MGCPVRWGPASLPPGLVVAVGFQQARSPPAVFGRGAEGCCGQAVNIPMQDAHCPPRGTRLCSCSPTAWCCASWPMALSVSWVR